MIVMVIAGYLYILKSFLFVIFLYYFQGLFSFSFSCLCTLMSVVSRGKHVHKSERVIMCKFLFRSPSLFHYSYLCRESSLSVHALLQQHPASPLLTHSHWHPPSKTSLSLVTERLPGNNWGLHALLNGTLIVFLILFPPSRSS